MDNGKLILDNGKSSLNNEKPTLNKGKPSMHNGTQTLDNGNCYWTIENRNGNSDRGEYQGYYQGGKGGRRSP